VRCQPVAPFTFTTLSAVPTLPIMPGGILPPLSVIFSWPVPNYVDPQTRGWGIIVMSIIVASTSLAVVCARLFARMRLRIIGIDDFIIVAAMVRAI
jgi:hypothetical protein